MAVIRHLSEPVSAQVVERLRVECGAGARSDQGLPQAIVGSYYKADCDIEGTNSVTAVTTVFEATAKDGYDS
eukprot:15480566-Alexandrium_andersonii.AAC.1